MPTSTSVEVERLMNPQQKRSDSAYGASRPLRLSGAKHASSAPCPHGQNWLDTRRERRTVRSMGSKSQRQRAAKRKRAQAKARPLTPDEAALLPRPLRGILEGFDRLDAQLENVDSFDAAIANVTRQIEALVDHVLDLATGYDAFDIVESLKLSETTVDLESYRETEHEGLAAVIEIASVILCTRGSRGGITPSGDGPSRRPDAIMDDVRDSCREIVELGSVGLHLKAMAAPSEGVRLALGAVLREIFVRNVNYEHMARDTLTGLFGVPHIKELCRETLGCTVSDIVSVIDELNRRHDEAWTERMGSLRQFMDFAKDAHSKWVASGAATQSHASDQPDVPQDVIDTGRLLLDATWDAPADTSIVDVPSVTLHTAMPESVVEAALNVLSATMSPADPMLAVQSYLEGRSPYRTRPLIRDPDRSSMPVHEGLLLSTVRSAVEDALKDHSKGWEIYAKYRGEYLEETSLALLAQMLPGAQVMPSVKYFVPDPAKDEAKPSDYTKLVECDGLLLIDDVAIIVEAKGGALGAEARAGDPDRLRADLRKLITEAAQQSRRLHERITEDAGIRLRDGTWLDLSGVREIHQIAVTLEDLFSLTSVTVDLLDAGLLEVDSIPWTVSVHDLRIVTELIERPAELLLYLQRRTVPEVTLHHHAIDELDLFLEFFANGLYVEPNPEQVHQRMPHLGEPPVAALRRYKSQTISFLTSRTDQLDAWYFHKLGVRETPAPKPTHNSIPEVRALVDALADVRSPGWLATGTNLLSGSSQLQHRFAKIPGDLRRLTKKDGDSHSYTIMVAADGADSALLVWATLGDFETLKGATRRLQDYLKVKKHQMQARTAAGVIFGASDQPVALLYDNTPPGPNETLDRLIAQSNLRAPNRAVDPRPRRRPKRRK